MADEPLYAGIAQPTELRRELLNSTKMVIDALRRFERINIIKEQKIKFIVELKKIMKEISSLNRKLKQSLPKTTVKPRPVSEKIIEEKTKLADLEDELVRVEEKLQSLE